MQLYPDQMECIRTILNGLSEIHERLNDMDVSDYQLVKIGKVPLEDKHGNIVAYAVDEIGGSFSVVSKDWS